MKECKTLQGRIHSLETFGSVDGPGVRFVAFMQGCALRCQFCHNPDTWDFQGGETYTPQALLDRALRYKGYWGEKGGVTVSGGEPLLQIDFLLEFFRLAKKKGVHTVIDTAGNPFTKKAPFFPKFQELMKYTDLLLLDIKEIDEDKHRLLTGAGNGNILEMANYLSEINKPVWIRHVLVPDRSDNDEDLKKMSDFLKTLRNVERVEVLPYHTMGVFKWQQLGLAYPLEGIAPPAPERVANANSLLETEKYTKYLDK